MNKKTLAIILEIIPVVSAAATNALIVSAADSGLFRWLIRITMLLAFLGFAFFLAGRRLCREDRVVRILGILACLATVSIAVLYIIAIFSFGL